METRSAPAPEGRARPLALIAWGLWCAALSFAAWVLPERTWQVDPHIQLSRLTWTVNAAAYASAHAAFAAACAAASLAAGAVVPLLGTARALGAVLIASGMATILLVTWTDPALRTACDAAVLFLGLVAVSALIGLCPAVARSPFRPLLAVGLLFLWVALIDPRPPDSATSFPWFSRVGHMRTRFAGALQVGGDDGWLAYLVLALAATPPLRLCAPFAGPKLGPPAAVLLVSLVAGVHHLNVLVREPIALQERERAVAKERTARAGTCRHFREVANRALGARSGTTLDAGLKAEIDRQVEVEMRSKPHSWDLATRRCPWENLRIVPSGTRTTIECAEHGR